MIGFRILLIWFPQLQLPTKYENNSLIIIAYSRKEWKISALDEKIFMMLNTTNIKHI